MTTLRATVRPCEHGRCRRKVATVTLVTKTTAVTAVVDAEGVPWDTGARIKLIASDHLGPGRQLAEKLTASQLHKAFGVKLFFRLHAEVCEVAQRRTTTSRKRAGHA